MIAGHLQEKKGYYYAVLSYKGADNKRKTKWLSTGLTVKGNKKRAEAFLMEQRQHFVILAADAPVPTGDELFADFLQRWLQSPAPPSPKAPTAPTAGCCATPLNRGSARSASRSRA